MKTKGSLLLRIIVWLVALAVALPLAVLIVRSFSNRWPTAHLLPQSFSLRGWQRLLSGYNDVWLVMAASVTSSLFTGALSTIISAMAARALCLYDFPGKRLIEGIAMLPIIVPATVIGMGSHMMFIRLGISNSVTAVILSHLAVTTPFSLRLMLETTRMVSGRLEEQARVLGAKPFAGFLHGTLPAIAPGMVSCWAVSFIFSYTQYFLTLLLGGGKVKTLSVIVMPLIEGADRTISSAFSLLFILSAAVVFWLLQALAAIVTQVCGKQLGG